MATLKKIIVFFTAVTFSALFTAGYSRSSVSDDPYAPLKLYDGKWDATMKIGGNEVIHLENHCSRTGLFFVCEQSVNGKPPALIVFLPIAKLPSGGEEYKNTALVSDTNPSGIWNKITIDGDKWTYSWEESDGTKKMLWRNVNQFSGSDKIHFEVQSSEDGATWKTVKAGDEIRQAK
jgi:hypothetical protein